MKHMLSFLFVLANIAKDSLCKVFNHIFSLGLLPFLNIFLFLIAILVSLLWGTIYLALEVHFLEWARMSNDFVWQLDDFHIIFWLIGSW